MSRYASTLVLFAAAACSPYPGATISDTPTGDLLVEVREAQSFNALARFLYDDAALGAAIAEITELPYSEGVPAGSVFTLPSKSELQRHASAERKVTSLLQKGMRSLEEGKFAQAAEQLEEARQIRPHRSDVILQLGIAKMRAGWLDEARPHLERAVSLTPEDPSARYALATLHRRSERLPEALEELQAAVDALGEDQVNSRIAYDYALTLKDLGHVAKARKAFQLFLYQFPSDPWSANAERNLEELEKLVEP